MKEGVSGIYLFVPFVASSWSPSNNFADACILKDVYYTVHMIVRTPFWGLADLRLTKIAVIFPRRSQNNRGKYLILNSERVKRERRLRSRDSVRTDRVPPGEWDDRPGFTYLLSS